MGCGVGAAALLGESSLEPVTALRPAVERLPPTTAGGYRHTLAAAGVLIPGRARHPTLIFVLQILDIIIVEVELLAQAFVGRQVSVLGDLLVELLHFSLNQSTSMANCLGDRLNCDAGHRAAA